MSPSDRPVSRVGGPSAIDLQRGGRDARCGAHLSPRIAISYFSTIYGTDSMLVVTLSGVPSAQRCKSTSTPTAQGNADIDALICAVGEHNQAATEGASEGARRGKDVRSQFRVSSCVGRGDMSE